MNSALDPAVVLFVANVQRVATFYEAVAQMRRLTEDDAHVVLAIDGFQLVIHRMYGVADGESDGTGAPVVREDSYTKLCLPVASLHDARATAKAHGGALKPATHEWEARGFRACDGHDPEGNVIQLRERAAV